MTVARLRQEKGKPLNKTKTGSPRVILRANLRETFSVPSATPLLSMQCIRSYFGSSQGHIHNPAIPWSDLCRHHRSGSVPQLLAYTYTKTAFPQHRRSRGQHTVCCTHNDRDTGFAAHTHRVHPSHKPLRTSSQDARPTRFCGSHRNDRRCRHVRLAAMETETWLKHLEKTG